MRKVLWKGGGKGRGTTRPVRSWESSSGADTWGNPFPGCFPRYLSWEPAKSQEGSPKPTPSSPVPITLSHLVQPPPFNLASVLLYLTCLYPHCWALKRAMREQWADGSWK